MGNASSQEHLQNNVFKTELTLVNKTISDIVNADYTGFKKDYYDFLDETKCDNYTVVLESHLKKHLKVHLEELQDNIYLLPKQDAISKETKVKTKSEICALISSHYTRVLQMFSLIKAVYDFEHNGDNSIGGLTWRNIRKTESLLEIDYCNMHQKELGKPENTLDFSQLAGFKMFCDTYLKEPEEKKRFLLYFRKLVEKDENLANAASCDKNYKDIFADKCDVKKGKELEDQLSKEITKNINDTLSFIVAAGNPIYSDKVCGQREKFVIDLTSRNKDVKNLIDKYNSMRKEYDTSFKNITNLVFELVDSKSKELKNLTKSDLDKTEYKLKQQVTRFYLKSLINYYEVLKSAKKIREAIVTEKDNEVIGSE
jgi:hypothetical protein